MWKVISATLSMLSSGGHLRRFLAFVGPAYLVSVGYMDPGNWATDIEGGARFGYALIWVLLMSNLMAVLLQVLAARLGVVTGLDLAQGCRREYPKFLNFFLWLSAETAIAATDLAEGAWDNNRVEFAVRLAFTLGMFSNCARYIFAGGIITLWCPQDGSFHRDAGRD